MEQNLSEKERKRRLIIGLSLATVSVIVYSETGNFYLSAALGLAATGFIFNYFTCFCGTKKLIKRIKKR
ncbi:MAG: hypothetical protein ABEJ56_06695 [Candidatus Nanohaloarchaea archaeon]